MPAYFLWDLRKSFTEAVFGLSPHFLPASFEIVFETAVSPQHLLPGRMQYSSL